MFIKGESYFIKLSMYEGYSSRDKAPQRNIVYKVQKRVLLFDGTFILSDGRFTSLNFPFTHSTVNYKER